MYFSFYTYFYYTNLLLFEECISVASNHKNAISTNTTKIYHNYFR